jgi:class 3 adenylate cyclase/Tfp pilus assembly protein PilF
MKAIYLLILFIFIYCLHVAQAQNPNIDSLFQVWTDSNQPDSTRMEAIDKIIRKGYLHTKPDSAFYYAQMHYDFAKTRELKREMAKALNTQAQSFQIRSDYPNALDYSLRCLKIREEILDKKGTANSLNNIGMIYQHLGNYPIALEYYKQSLKITEERSDTLGIPGTLINIGTIYDHQGEYARALEYYEKSLTLKDKIPNKKALAACYINIGSIYLKQDNFDQALDHFYQGLKVCEEHNFKDFMANVLMNIGVVYKNQSNYPKAMDYYQQSLSISEEISYKSGVVFNLLSIGILYKSQGLYDQSEEWCNQALNLAEQLGTISQQKDACNCLYDSYKALGNANMALDYLEKMLALTDSLHTVETIKKLQQMEFAKQMLADSLKQVTKEIEVQHAHETEMRKKNRTRNISIGTGLLVLIIAISLYSRLRYTRKAKAIIEKEKDRSENLLLNILPAEIAAELKEKGEADARDFETVSILFTDFKEFTQMSEKLSAVELVAEINHCFKGFDQICEKYGVEKIKTIGDAYMAAGGLPVPKDDSTKNTVLAAIEMTDFILKRKAERETLGHIPFKMRLGIHTGSVVAGIVGVKKFQYDIWGDTVNTASRMESSGEIGRVNISQCTYEIIKDDAAFKFEPRGKIEAKGKGSMEMWFVERGK